MKERYGQDKTFGRGYSEITDHSFCMNIIAVITKTRTASSLFLIFLVPLTRRYGLNHASKIMLVNFANLLFSLAGTWSWHWWYCVDCFLSSIQTVYSQADSQTTHGSDHTHRLPIHQSTWLHVHKVWCLDLHLCGFRLAEIWFIRRWFAQVHSFCLFVAIRYTQPPADLIEWYDGFLDDEEVCHSG